jgi:hypothetical protein
MKLIFTVQNSRRSTFEIKAFAYEVFKIFKNENRDTGNDFCMFIAADYSFPIGKQVFMGIADSVLWHHAYYDRLSDTQKWTNNTKLYIAWRR